jgi:NADPH-dependent glutamate synthase beta subunit-like oxidoreductase/CO/xanthine dehydrogenase FAD-binding subunit
MKKFRHINAGSLAEAASILQKYGKRARVIAGGTDILGEMKDDILPEYPEVIVNIKSISGLDYVKEEDDGLHIGALTRLEDIANDKKVTGKYRLLAEAAHRTASPHIREMGTIAGNICQSNRCWYYWVPDNRFYCLRKGGKLCYALTGDGRYHSIFGATRVNSTPCSTECPAHNDIPFYLSQIREGKIAEAAATLLKTNPLPAITGRVCPHFCEGECNRDYLDEAVSIRSTERFLGDYILQNRGRLFKSPKTGNQKNAAIIGSGPTGLAAAYYLRNLGYGVTVYEAMDKAGGMMIYGIPTYRLPKDVVNKQVEALENMGIRFKLGTRLGTDIKIEKLTKSFDAVLLACGAWKERSSGIIGDQFTLSAIEILRDSNSGGRETPGKKVAVIGGGNSAVDVARTLLRLGAEPVIVYRRSKAEMPALKEEVEKAEQEGIKIHFLTSPLEAAKRRGKVVLKCTRMKLGPPDASGRPRPVPIRGSDFSVEYDAVVKAIGEEPDTSIVPADRLDQDGRLKFVEAGYALGKNLFAAGDFATGPATVVAAISAGREAAKSIDRYLGGEALPAESGGSHGSAVCQKFDSNYLKKTSRAEIAELPVKERIGNIELEDVAGLKSGDVKMEASRCFNCGCVAVNSSDVAPALIALDAKIRTTRRVIGAEEFFTVDVDKTTVLNDDELVTEIKIPKPRPGTKYSFTKFAIRKSIDFPIVNCAAAIESRGGVVKAARICLNAVYNTPYRVTKAENLVVGKRIDDSIADNAASGISAEAFPIINNRYKIQIAKTLVKRAILACTSQRRGNKEE